MSFCITDKHLSDEDPIFIRKYWFQKFSSSHLMIQIHIKCLGSIDTMIGAKDAIIIKNVNPNEYVFSTFHMFHDLTSFACLVNSYLNESNIILENSIIAKNKNIFYVSMPTLDFYHINKEMTKKNCFFHAIQKMLISNGFEGLFVLQDLRKKFNLGPEVSGNCFRANLLGTEFYIPNSKTYGKNNKFAKYVWITDWDLCLKKSNLYQKIHYGDIRFLQNDGKLPVEDLFNEKPELFELYTKSSFEHIMQYFNEYNKWVHSTIVCFTNQHNMYQMKIIGSDQNTKAIAQCLENLITQAKQSKL